MSKKLEGYDVAQMCPNGHVANATTIHFPESNKEFCSDCGEKTMTACPKCQKSIQGYHWGSVTGKYRPPAFCIYCGEAFPWTERKVQAAIELFADEVTPEEATAFGESVRAIAKDRAAAQVASGRIVRQLKKVATGTRDAIRDILVDIASETAKRMLFPPGS